MTASRPLTGLERVWLVADRLWPPFVNQLVVEGEGALDPDAVRRAIDTILPAWPGARARLRGVLGRTRWVADGEAPAVTIAEPWDGRGPAPWGDRRLDPWTGPVVELVLAPGHVVLRTHHAAFDGRAAWALAEDLGAALRGEPVRGATFDGVTDTILAGSGPAEAPPPEDAILPTGPASGADVGTTGLDGGATWVRVTLPVLGRGVLPRTIVALGRAVELREGGSPTSAVSPALRVSVPVDLRRYSPDLRAAANLTGFVRVGVDATTRPADVAASLEHALADRAELGAVRAAHRLRGVPLAWMEAAGRAAAHRALTTGRGATSATVSNLGRQDPGVLAGPGFRPRRSFWIPPSGAGSPLFVTLTGNPDGIELCAGMPRVLADGGRIDALVTRLARELVGGPAAGPRTASRST